MEPTKQEGGNFNSKDLFKKAMAGDWLAVVEIYKNNPPTRRAKITRAKHTVLHLAVSSEDDNVVKQLVDAIQEDEALDILSLQNDSGDTPLHVAAALGLAKICWLLAEKCKELVVSARNNARETPLYVAARHGKKKTFFVLQDYVSAIFASEHNHHISFCRRGDGNTILHAAVDGEYFELAIEIITLYPSLVNFNNEMGQSPLHLLADKPQVFKSGNPPRHIIKLFYPCIVVDRLEPTYNPELYKRHFNGWKNKIEIKGPQNYATCMKFFRMLCHVYYLIVSCFGERSMKNCCTANEGHSLEDKNEDGMHAPSSKDLERDEEHGNLVRSAKPKFPENYTTEFNFLKIMIKFLLFFLGGGISIIEMTKRMKKQHEYACQVMKDLVSQSSNWEYEKDEKMPNKDQEQDEHAIDTRKILDEDSSASNCESLEGINKNEDKKTDEQLGTPILVAAKRGIVEMVKNILDTFPVAIEDLDYNHKNIILLSVEHRQLQVYKHMLERKSMRERVFAMVDKDGNSALHLVAGTTGKSHPWVIPGPALQIQWDIKWYKYVKNSMEPHFFQLYNNKGQTANEIFSKAHEILVKEGVKWMTNTSQSCSVIAALIATVAFASATAIPGGVDETSGFPILKGRPAFDVFAIPALVALFFSIISLIAFLLILTTHYQVMLFERFLPMMLIMGLTTLFMSMTMMMISFSAGFSLVMEDYKELPVYLAMCLPITLTMFQFPLYVYLLKATFVDVPKNSYGNPSL